MQNLNQELEVHANSLVEDVTKGRKRRRFTMLKASELTGLPGATPAGTKPVERDVAFIQFKLPVSASVGTTSESGEILSFASTLGDQSQTLGVGSVSNIVFGDGSAEVVLKLDAAVDPDNHGSAAANAFTKLGEFLSTAQVLQATRAGRRAVWRAKINGTTIAQGSY